LERIESESAVLDLIASKAVERPTLAAVLDSYSRSITDPANELVHLYEVWDALTTHFGSEAEAMRSLGISGGQKRTLTKLANVEPVSQGRHRGKDLGKLRSATDAELEAARTLVRGWIVALARML
jgi:hypothetical protein